MKLYYLQCKQFQFAVGCLAKKVRWAVFRALAKFFYWQRCLSPLRKIGPYADGA